MNGRVKEFDGRLSIYNTSHLVDFHKHDLLCFKVRTFSTTLYVGTVNWLHESSLIQQCYIYRNKWYSQKRRTLSAHLIPNPDLYTSPVPLPLLRFSLTLTQHPRSHKILVPRNHSLNHNLAHAYGLSQRSLIPLCQRPRVSPHTQRAEELQ